VVLLRYHAPRRFDRSPDFLTTRRLSFPLLDRLLLDHLAAGCLFPLVLVVVICVAVLPDDFVPDGFRTNDTAAAVFWPATVALTASRQDLGNIVGSTA
jgi:hypothetical protein